MKRSFAALLATLLAILPVASVAAARAAAERPSDLDPKSHVAFDVLGAGEPATALPDAPRLDRVVHAPSAPGPALHRWPRWVAAPLERTRLLTPVGEPRTRRGHTIPRRCAPRMRDDPDEH